VNNKIDTIAVPAALPFLITEHRLAGNDISVLLLVMERTMNISPPQRSTLLSIRYIAEQIGCSPKGAWNSVTKLKELDLVLHEVPKDHKKAALLGLNYRCFSTTKSETPNTAVTRVNLGLAESPPEQLAVARELQEIREILYSHINVGKKVREHDLPEPFLAANLLDYFGSSVSVEAWVRKLHVGWKKKKYSAKGYGLYGSSLKKLRDADLNRSIGQLLQAVPVTEPFALPAPLPSRSRLKKVDLTKVNFLHSTESSDEMDYDYHEKAELGP
jgi:hypothetical protein